jgi:hypothetical protein
MSISCFLLIVEFSFCECVNECVMSVRKRT